LRFTWFRVLVLALLFLLSFTVYVYFTTETLSGEEQRLEDTFDTPIVFDAINWKERQNTVREAFKHAWRGYVRDAWGCDEYHPLSHRGSNLTGIGIGFTIVDSLDTLLIMDLKEEFRHARDWVAKSLNFDHNGGVNVFETTIRVLGGLLSAYHLSGNDTLFLTKAIDLGDRLLGAFSSSSGIPYGYVDLGSKRGLAGTTSTAEATTLQLEFKYLSYLTDNEKYWEKAEKVMFKIDSLEKTDGLVPILVEYDKVYFNSKKIINLKKDEFQIIE
jgi:endoplasmic reticulum Man9GlcNAc2 1,2-alpha-mannosidase